MNKIIHLKPIELISIFALHLIIPSIFTMAKNCEDPNEVVYSISDCDPYTMSYNHKISKIDSNRFEANYTYACEYDEVTYDWEIRNEDDTLKGEFKNNPTKNILHLEPFYFQSGQYILAVALNFWKNGKIFHKGSRFGCSIEVVAEPPIPIIRGGDERFVNAKKSFIMNASESIDREDNSGKSLIFNWTCTNSASDFCSTHHEGQIITIPPQYAIDGYIYVFTVHIKTKTSDWVTNQQRVIVKDNVVELEIICEKNCPPASPTTNYKLPTYLRAKCLTHCESIIKDDDYQWQIKPDLKQKTEYGLRSCKLIMKKETLTPNGTYEIEVSLPNISSNIILGKKSIKVAPTPEIKSCQVSPGKGIEITTNFTVDCNYTGNINIFEIFTRNKFLDLQLVRGSSLASLNFILPSNPQVFIKGIDKNLLFTQEKLKVQVDSLPNIDMKAFIETFASMIKAGRLSAAIQIINTLVERVNSKEKLHVLQQFNNATIKSYEEAAAVAAVTSELTQSQSDQLDPLIAVEATALCKKSAEIGFQHLQKELYPRTIDYTSMSNNLMSCGIKDMKENETLSTPIRVFNISTTFAPIPMEVITENYPDYVDTVAVSEEIEKYKEAALNMISICETNTKAMSLTVAEGENVFLAETNISSAAVLKWDGTNLNETIINLKQVRIDPSADLANVLPVDVKICVWNENFLWWGSRKLNVSSSIVYLKLQSAEKEMKEFVDPLKISLKVNADMFYKVYQVDVLEDLPDVRVAMKKGDHFYIQFYNLSDSDRIKLFVSHFEKPADVEKLQVAKVIRKNDSGMFFQYDYDYDGWQYVYIKSSLKKYWISVYTHGCYTWDLSKDDWIFSCNSDSNSNRSFINCECNHLSIISGAVHNIPIQIENITIRLKVEMILTGCPVIFICSCVIFAIYCILLLIFRRKTSVEQHQRNIFFLGDVSYAARFSYLLVIKTGSQKGAGTSSNVCIRVVGDLNSSMHHVLNYPDQEKRLLRNNNEDWFVMATENYLGPLKEIRLWYDCSGKKPTWFCEKVTIYDMQTQREYAFPVLQWLKLPPEGNADLKVPVSHTEEVKAEKTKSKCRKCLECLKSLKYYTEPLTKSSPCGLSIFNRLTLDLCAILTIFLIVLLLYGIPKMRMNDCLGRYYKYGLYEWIFIFAFVSFLLTVVLQILYIYCFKLAQSKRINDVNWYLKFQTICWIVLITYLVLLFTILIVFGFWLPCVMALLWLTSVCIAVLCYFIVEKFLYKLIKVRPEQTPVNVEEKKLSPMDHIEEIRKVVEDQRQYLFKIFGEQLLRPFFRHLYRPLKTDDVILRRKRQMMKTKFFNLLEDIVMFFVYILLLYSVIYANRETLSAENHRVCLNLIDGTLTRTESFEDIGNVEGLFNYVNNTLIVALQSAQWYWKYIVINPGATVDLSHKYLGVVRIRQHRIIQKSCTIPKQMKSFFPYSDWCHSEFSSTDEETERLTKNITPIERLDSIFHYTGFKTDPSLIVGKFGIYKGGGYISPLGRTIYNSYVNLDYLEKAKWIDSHTRAVVIEFLLYNANINVFTSVQIMVEKSASGYIRTDYEIESARLLYVKDEKEVTEIVLFLAFLVVVLIFMAKIFYKMLKKKLSWKDRWIIVDFLIITLSVSCFALFVHRMQLVKSFLSDIEKALKNTFVPYVQLFYYETVLTLVAALLIFVATIRLWKLLRFASTFKIMEKTIALSFRSIMALMLCHLLMLLAFGIAAHEVFIDVSDHFKDLPDTFVTLVLVSIDMHETFDVKDIIYEHPTATRIFYLLYMFSTRLLFTFYIALVMIYYYEARKIYSGSSEFQQVRTLVRSEILYYTSLAKLNLFRTKGGADSKQNYVSPKDEQHRYENSQILSSSKLTLMTHIVRLNVLRKRIPTRQQKLRVMKEIAINVIKIKCGEGEDEIFFTTHMDNELKVVPNSKILVMEKIVKNMLSTSSDKKTKKMKYDLLMEYQKQKLDFMSSMLTSILNIVNNIDFTDE